MSDELVSVIIPTFNRAYCIARAIDSAANQSHRAVEIIVVDDGSSDDTGALIARRYAGDPRIRYIRQDNQGVSAARNHGLRKARGDYVALLDSDDVWKPWKLELQLCCLRSLPQAGMIWTDMEAIGPDGNRISAKYLRTMYKASYRWFATHDLFPDSQRLADLCPNLPAATGDAAVYWGDIFSPMIMGNLVHTSTVLVRRDRLSKVVGFNEELKHSGEDYDFHLRTCREGPVAFVDISTVEYQVGRSDQLTQPAYRIHMANNFLKTIAPVIAAERDRIHLPSSMLSYVQAEAHAWIGREYLALGRQREARTEFRTSLHYRLRQPDVWMMSTLALCPPYVYRGLRAAVRGLKQIWRRRAASAGKTSEL